MSIDIFRRRWTSDYRLRQQDCDFWFASQGVRIASLE